MQTIVKANELQPGDIWNNKKIVACECDPNTVILHFEGDGIKSFSANTDLLVIREITVVEA